MNNDTPVKMADFTSLRVAREDRNNHNNYPYAKGNQLGFAMAIAATQSNVPLARQVVLRIKGMQ